jgi:hypothetical protein
MKAELTHQPESGAFEEFHFEHPTVWNSQVFSWVKFKDQEDQDWFGSFRGESLGHLAISELTGTVMIPTKDGTYLLDINSRQLLNFYGVEHQIRSVITAPSGRIFILASYSELYRTSDEHKLIHLPCQLNMAFIKLKLISGNNVEFEFEENGVWNKTQGILNTETWKVE